MDIERFQRRQHEMEVTKSVFGQTGSHHLSVADLFKLSFRVFRVRPTRTILTILGMAVGIGTVLFLVSLGYGLQYILIGKLATTEDSLISLEVFYPAESNLALRSANLQKIEADSNVSEVSPVAEVTGEAKANNIAGYLLVKVVNPDYFRLAGTSVDIGKAFTGKTPSVVISSSALKLFNKKEDISTIGDVVNVRIFYQADEKSNAVQTIDTKTPLIISGITINEDEPPFIIVPADSLKSSPPAYARAFVKAKNIDSVESLRNKLINEGYIISAKIDLVNQAQKVLTAITIILGIFGVAALIVSAIGMFNTMIIGFLERSFEVGIMKSIGASARDIRNLFLMESVIMGLMGGVGGILLGILAGQTFNFGLNILARYLGGKPVDLFIYPLQFMAFIVGLSIVVGLVAGFWPARRAAKLSPKEAFIRK